MRAVWFEIPVNDMNCAKKFYESIFLVQLADPIEMGPSYMSFFPLESDANEGANGTLIKEENYIPSHEGSMVYFSVEEINDVLPRIGPAGGKVLNEKMSIGEHGFVAHFEDCEGNRVALHQKP